MKKREAKGRKMKVEVRVEERKRVKGEGREW